MKEYDEETAEALQDGLGSVARALDRLGTGNAGTDMGAVEYLAQQVREGSERVAAALEKLAEAIRDARD